MEKSAKVNAKATRAHLEFLWLTRWLVRHSNAWINKRHSEIQIPAQRQRHRAQKV